MGPSRDVSVGGLNTLSYGEPSAIFVIRFGCVVVYNVVTSLFAERFTMISRLRSLWTIDVVVLNLLKQLLMLVMQVVHRFVCRSWFEWCRLIVHMVNLLVLSVLVRRGRKKQLP